MTSRVMSFLSSDPLSNNIAFTIFNTGPILFVHYELVPAKKGVNLCVNLSPPSFFSNHKTLFLKIYDYLQKIEAMNRNLT
jgi:hypothetical protein